MLKTITLIAFNKIEGLKIDYISERRKEELVEIIKLASRTCT